LQTPSNNTTGLLFSASNTEYTVFFQSKSTADVSGLLDCDVDSINLLLSMDDPEPAVVECNPVQTGFFSALLTEGYPRPNASMYSSGKPKAKTKAVPQTHMVPPIVILRLKKHLWSHESKATSLFGLSRHPRIFLYF
jgi:hypothetical protein